MKIDRRLNLVVPIYGTPTQKSGPNGKPLFEGNEAVMDTPVVAWVHSQPLSAETVDRDFLLLGQTFNAIFTEGLGAAAGPGHSLRLLRVIAERQGVWTNKDTTPGSGKMLVEEIRRLTNVVVPGERGWETIPLEVAVQVGKLAEDDKAEVENAIVFFICVSATLARAEKQKMLSSFADLWDAQLSSSNATEWAASLKISTPAGNSGARSPAPVASAAPVADARVDGRPASVPR